jgi:hypothetical protein
LGKTPNKCPVETDEFVSFEGAPQSRQIRRRSAMLLFLFYLFSCGAPNLGAFPLRAEG